MLVGMRLSLNSKQKWLIEYQASFKYLVKKSNATIIHVSCDNSDVSPINLGNKYD